MVTPRLSCFLSLCFKSLTALFSRCYLPLAATLLSIGMPPCSCLCRTPPHPAARREMAASGAQALPPERLARITVLAQSRPVVGLWGVATRQRVRRGIVSMALPHGRASVCRGIIVISIIVVLPVLPDAVLGHWQKVGAPPRRSRMLTLSRGLTKHCETHRQTYGRNSPFAGCQWVSSGERRGRSEVFRTIGRS